ncbi:MAG: c-type cytochrome domain-containing protein, partial [Pirellulaceae bacterium]
MARTCRTGIPIVLLVAACGVPALRGAPVDYERDIKPLLRSRCLSCHGALKQEGGLRLDTGERIRAGGTSGPAVTVGQPDDSLLWKRTTAEDPAERMPPDGDPLTSTELDQLREWIRAGAASPAGERADADPRDHWAFQPPRRGPLPVAQSARAANPIDAFVEAELGQHGLVPR